MGILRRLFGKDRRDDASWVADEPLYGIKAGYAHRRSVGHFDDTGNEEEYQREVYEHAVWLASEIGAKSVLDVGCGSGFKLMKYLSHLSTIGLEVEPTLSHLKQTYPDRDWRESDLTMPPQGLPADLVICADVIEHIEDPDVLLAFFQALPFQKLVLSTPDRDLMVRNFRHRANGPPGNPYHYREWTMPELAAYVGAAFDIESHRISNEAQATQMMVCRRKR